MAAQAILFTSWYTGLGGGETDLLVLAAQLAPDYTPHLLLPHEGQLSARWREQGWPVHIVPFRGATTYFVPAVWARLPVVQKIERLLRTHPIRLLHSDYHTLPMAFPAAQRAGIPTVWTCWGWWFRPQPWQRDFFRQIDQIVARSVAIQKGFLGKPPFMPPQRVPLIYSGVDTARFHPDVDRERVRADAQIPPKVPVVAMVARFQSVKGHHIFQQMARQVVLQVPKAQFIVAGEEVFGVSGDQAYKTRILHTAQHDPLLAESLHYLGFRDDVERVMSAADVVVCASEFESYGKAIVEAMAVGKPVVSTRRGGPSETIVHGETGYLVEPDDAASLAMHVIHLLRDAEMRQRMGQRGRERVIAQFSARAMGEQYRALFAQWLA